MREIILNNGIKIKSPGFGTWTLDDISAEDAVLKALSCGYRHIDTAEYYKNEVGVGKAIKASGIARDEIFVTSKLWTTSRGYNEAIEALNGSLSRLGLDYLDLFLIHWPAVPEKHDNWREINLNTWRALEHLYKEGKVRAIGLSNFMENHISALLQDAEIAPMVNQIEFHPGYMQKECVEFCKKNGIALTAWAPLGRGEALEHPIICEIAKKHGVTPAKVTLSWVWANGLIPLVKSSNINRMKENLTAIDVALTDEDVEKISSLSFWGKLGKRPEKVNF